MCPWNHPGCTTATSCARCRDLDRQIERYVAEWPALTDAQRALITTLARIENQPHAA